MSDVFETHTPMRMVPPHPLPDPPQGGAQAPSAMSSTRCCFSATKRLPKRHFLPQPSPPRTYAAHAIARLRADPTAARQLAPTLSLRFRRRSRPPLWRRSSTPPPPFTAPSQPPPRFATKSARNRIVSFDLPPLRAVPRPPPFSRFPPRRLLFHPHPPLRVLSSLSPPLLPISREFSPPFLPVRHECEAARGEAARPAGTSADVESNNFPPFCHS